MKKEEEAEQNELAVTIEHFGNQVLERLAMIIANQQKILDKMDESNNWLERIYGDI